MRDDDAGYHSDFADDLLLGAKAISIFLFKSPERCRAVYHLVANSRLPTFRLGSRIAARKSVLLRWVEDQE